MTISASVSKTQRDAANAALENLGFGPDNFSVPLHQGVSPATHYGLHAWDDADFIAAIEALSVASLRILKQPGQSVNFSQHLSNQGLQKMEVEPI